MDIRVRRRSYEEVQFCQLRIGGLAAAAKRPTLVLVGNGL